jgi:hypothetical protein
MLRKASPGQGRASSRVLAGIVRYHQNRLADGDQFKEYALERRLLQITVAIAGLVPVAGGLAGVIWGPAMLGEPTQGPFDSHFRYLSGLLAAIGVAYWSAIPDIETANRKFSLLTLIVVAGGFSRALGMLIAGPPGGAMNAALIMELVVTPALYLWQARIQRLATVVDLAPAQG